MPVVTLILVILNLAIYVFECALGGSAICAEFGLVPAHWNVESSFTSLFLHDPSSLSHLAGNVVFLAIFGTVVETEVGSFQFAALYGLAGLLGGLTHVLVAPAAIDPLVGCSACIFGLMPVAALARPRACLAFVVVLVGFNLYQLMTATGGTVSVAAHVGGFSVGVLFAALSRSSLVQEERFA